MESPLISIIMPVYNSENYVSFAIESILNQTYRNFEFIIVDDGSTDNTKKIISFYEDKRIIYRQKEHSGISDSLNLGLEIARGEWIARMDSDDISYPDRLEKQMKYIQNNCDISVLSTAYAIFKSYKKIQYIIKNPEKDDNIKRKFILYNSICHPSVIFKRKTILSLGGYNFSAFESEDYELWIRIADSVVFGNITEILLLKRFNEKDSFKRHNKEFKNEILNMLINYLYKTNLQGEDFLKYYLLINYYYGDKFILRKILKYNSLVTKSIKNLILYLLTFLPYSLFNIKFNRWVEWRLNSFRTFFNKDKYRFKKLLKYYEEK